MIIFVYDEDMDWVGIKRDANMKDVRRWKEMGYRVYHGKRIRFHKKIK